MIINLKAPNSFDISKQCPVCGDLLSPGTQRELKSKTPTGNFVLSFWFKVEKSTWRYCLESKSDCASRCYNTYLRKTSPIFTTRNLPETIKLIDQIQKTTGWKRL